MRLVRFICLLVTLLGIGCHTSHLTPTTPPPLRSVQLPVVWEIWIDPTFTRDERRAITGAMQAWSEATGNQVRWVIRDSLRGFDPPACPTQISILNTPGWTPVGALAAIDPHSRGSVVAKALVACHPRAIFVLTDRIVGTATASRQEMFRRVLMHELGHQLGIKHLPRGVMTEMVTDSSSCPTKSDLVEFCRINHCRSDLLRPCDQRGSTWAGSKDRTPEHTRRSGVL